MENSDQNEIKNCDTNPENLLSENERKSSISGIPPPPSSAPPKLPEFGESSEKSSTNIALESSEKSSEKLDSSVKDSASSEILLESTETKPKKKKIGMKKNRKKKVENTTAKVDINKDIHSKIQGLD